MGRAKRSAFETRFFCETHQHVSRGPTSTRPMMGFGQSAWKNAFCLYPSYEESKSLHRASK